MRNRKIFFISLFSILLAAYCFIGNSSSAKAASGDWENVGPDAIGENGYWPSLAFHPLTHQPYIVYRDNTNNWRATVKKFDGSSWSDVGIPGMSYASAAYTRIAFNDSGDPYVAYKDSARGGKISVLKFNGENWQYVGDETFSDGGASYIRLAFNPLTDEPYVAYSDANCGSRITVKKFGGASWENVGAPGVSDGSAAYLSLAFNPDTGQAYVAYADVSIFSKAVVKKWNGSSWETVGSSGFSPSGVGNIDIAFNPSTSEPYVVFEDATNDEYKATVMKFSGSGWEYAGNPQFSASEIQEPLIAFNPVTSEPHIAFGDDAYSDRVSVMKFTGSGWEYVGTPGFSEYSSGNNNKSFVFDPFTKEPYLVIAGGGSGNRIAVWKYNKTVLSPATVAWSAKKTKQKVNFTFQDLNLSTKKSKVMIRINGKKVKISRVRKSGVNTVASGVLNHKKWARGSYDATVSMKYKIGRTTRTKTWTASDILSIY